MTTMTAESTHTPANAADPAAGLQAHLSIRSTVSHTMTLAWRALKKMRRNPEQFMDVTLQPLLFTAMFAYVFGGAISGDVDSYLPALIPGVLTMGALTACMATGVQLREDMDKGVFDRFRALPIARIAPLAGPMVADLVRYALAGTLTFAAGILMGYRPGGGVAGSIGAIALVMVCGWSMAWIFTWIGTWARSASSVQGISMMFLFPLTFLSNAFVPADTLPDWLHAFANINPVSHVVTAARSLANDGAMTGEVGWSLIACAVVVAIFAPLSVWSYKRSV